MDTACHAKRMRVKEITEHIESVRSRCKLQEEDLNQQATDLAFYLRFGKAYIYAYIYNII
jgi:3'-phosphoadenosine 5'-phosphosulfate sulfotransferase